MHFRPTQRLIGCRAAAPARAARKTSLPSTSIFVSHSRRDPATLNMAYAFVSALRWARKLDGSPICSATWKGAGIHCHELWLDKEQLPGLMKQTEEEKQPHSWQQLLAKAQARSPLHLFFIGSTWIGSRHCMRELYLSQRLGKQVFPVFLESRPQTAAEFESVWPHTRRSVKELSDVKDFADWSSCEDDVERRLQGFPGLSAVKLQPLDFVCSHCRDSRDSVCPQCSKWTQHGKGDFFECALSLGTLIDKFLDPHVKNPPNTQRQPPTLQISHISESKKSRDAAQPAASCLLAESTLRSVEQNTCELSSELLAQLDGESIAQGTVSCSDGYADVLHRVHHARILTRDPPPLLVAKDPGGPYVPEALCGQECNHSVYFPGLLHGATALGIRETILAFLPPSEHSTGRKRTIVKWPALSAALWAKLSAFWPTSVELHSECWIPIGIGAGWQCVGYEEGGFHAFHKDECTVLDINTKSLQSLIIYAAEPGVDYSGGEFVFHDQGDEWGCVPPLHPPAGSVLALSHTTPHEALPVTSGRKWILRSDVIVRRQNLKHVTEDAEAVRHFHYARILRTRGFYAEADAAESKAYELSSALHFMRFRYDPASRRNFVAALSK